MQRQANMNIQSSPSLFHMNGSTQYTSGTLFPSHNRFLSHFLFLHTSSFFFNCIVSHCLCIPYIFLKNTPLLVVILPFNFNFWQIILLHDTVGMTSSSLPEKNMIFYSPYHSHLFYHQIGLKQNLITPVGRVW